MHKRQSFITLHNEILITAIADCSPRQRHNPFHIISQFECFQFSLLCYWMNNEIEENFFGAKFGKFCGKCERERKFVVYARARKLFENYPENCIVNGTSAWDRRWGQKNLRKLQRNNEIKIKNTFFLSKIKFESFSLQWRLFAITFNGLSRLLNQCPLNFIVTNFLKAYHSKSLSHFFNYRSLRCNLLSQSLV